MMKTTSRSRTLCVSIGLLVSIGFLVSCGATIRPEVRGGYDWTHVNKICVIGVSELDGSTEISRALTHNIFETGYPVVMSDSQSVLDIYDVGRREGADIIAYGVVSKVETYYGHQGDRHGRYNPTKEVELELQFIETETRRRIWKGSGNLVESANVLDAFIINELVGKMVHEILPPWSEVQRDTAAVPMLKAGGEAPLFEVSDVRGDRYALEDHLGKDVVVLSFFSFFCDPCKRGMKTLNDVHLRYDSKGVNVLAVSLEGEPLLDKIRSHIYQENLEFTFLLDKAAGEGGNVADQYNVSGTPALYIIGKSGEIVFARSGHVTFDELNAVIESELAKK